jgi:hypothetical protein
MSREIIPDYMPDKCFGCDVIGMALSRRDEAINNMGVPPSRSQISEAARMGNIARALCDLAEQECPGIAEGCILKNDFNL